ncbi:MAG: DUF3696 domain-containing protein [Phycisphaerales bacterium]|nr:DUF3696 domain-containing protein [Phycisphaerales bacterium]
MLTAIEIENFKAFGERQRIELRPLTLLFGPNSGGKSSIIHALHYAREIMLGRGCDIHRTESGAGLVDLGGLRRLVHGRELDGRMITLRFELDLSTYPLELNLDESLVSLELLDEWEPLMAIPTRVESAALTLRIPAEEGALVEEFGVDLNGVPFAAVQTPPNQPRSTIAAINWSHPILFDTDLWTRKSQAWMEFAELADQRHKAGKMAGLPPDVLEQVGPAVDLVQRVLSSQEGNKSEHTSLAERIRKIVKAADTDANLFRTMCLFAGMFGDEPLAGMAKGADEAHRMLLEVGNSLEDLYRAACVPDGEERFDASLNLADVECQCHRLHRGIPDWDGWLSIYLDGGLVPSTLFNHLMRELILGPGRALRDALQNFRYLGPLRSIPPPRLPRPDPIGYSDWPSGLGAWHRLAADADLAENTSAWLREEHRLNTGYRLSTRRSRVVDDALLHQLLSDQTTAEESDGPVDLDRYPGLAEIPPETTFAIEDIRRGITVDPCDIGVGLSQVIPVIVAALDKQAPLVAIEQPALHLHPTAQAAVGDLLLEGALKHPGRVIIAETHSEHAILRILRRLREQRYQAHSIRINFVSSEDSVSSGIRIIDISDYGELIDPWPDNFFDQDFMEKFA